MSNNFCAFTAFVLLLYIFLAIHKIPTRVFQRGCGLHILPTLVKELIILIALKLVHWGYCQQQHACSLDIVSQSSWVWYPVWPRTFVYPSADSRRAVVSYWRKYVHEVLVNRLGGLSLPRKSVVRFR